MEVKDVYEIIMDFEEVRREFESIGDDFRRVFMHSQESQYQFMVETLGVEIISILLTLDSQFTKFEEFLMLYEYYQLKQGN